MPAPDASCVPRGTRTSAAGAARARNGATVCVGGTTPTDSESSGGSGAYSTASAFDDLGNVPAAGALTPEPLMACGRRAGSCASNAVRASSAREVLGSVPAAGALTPRPGDHVGRGQK